MIDKNAIVVLGAKIAPDVYVGPFSVSGEEVEIGAGSWIGPHVVIQGKTTIGKNNKVFQFASIGADPQHTKYAGEDTSVEIGDNNVFHEYCSIHRGTVQGHKVTKIGDRNFLMAYTHVAHDCILGNDNIFANTATLAGHVTIGNNIVLGGFVKILQFCTLGDYCFIAGDTGITKDVLPYVFVSALHGQAKTYGLNLIGLKRHGFSVEVLHTLKHAYNIICRQGLGVEEAITALNKMLPDCQEIVPLIEILSKTKRGIVR